MSDTEVEAVWKGAEGLRESLVSIDELEPFPGNARIGDVERVAASLERFGQVKPVVVEGRKIIAGHHVVKGAAKLGWTHVGVLEHEFGSDAEQLAFNVADNRTSDLGGYDDELLLAQLAELRDADSLYGTGYDQGDVTQIEADLEALRALHDPPDPPPFFPPLDPDLLETTYCCPSCRYSWSGDPKAGCADEAAR